MEFVMPERPITHLRHVDIAVQDYEKQVAFYEEKWGLTKVGTDGDVTYFAAEGSPEQYVIRVRRSQDKRLDLVSYGAADRATVDALATRLARDGVKLVGGPDTLQTPGGGYGFRFFDVEGRTIEISTEVAARTHRKVEEREDIPVRLSHVVLNSPEPERLQAFYEKYLDFRLTDTNVHPKLGGIMWFMRCNPQHHSMAIARCPHVSLHHASFEMRGLDEYMRGSGRLMRDGVHKVWGPGRHRAGDNTFTYFHDPNGNTMEYTTELETLDEDTWHPHLYSTDDPETSDQWGTSNPMNDFVSREMFNDPDRGLFIAPPV
jgi:catechol 2,3-dioxygenase-like lactoylglutathione lyase family enzyme